MNCVLAAGIGFIFGTFMTSFVLSFFISNSKDKNKPPVGSEDKK